MAASVGRQVYEVEVLQRCNTYLSTANASLTLLLAHGRFDSTAMICNTKNAPGDQSSGDRLLKWQPSKSPEKKLGYRKAAEVTE